MDVWTVGKGREGRTGRLELTYIQYHVSNSWLVEGCGIAQAVHLGAL